MRVPSPPKLAPAHASGIRVPSLKSTSWPCFGLLLFAILLRARVTTWRVLDYIWAGYLILVVYLVLSNRVRLEEPE